MKKYKKIFLIVIDSLGIGKAEDAYKYLDGGANTFSHIVKNMPDIKIPNLLKLGIGTLSPESGYSCEEFSKGRAMRLKERSCGKDTTTGHWEMVGLETKKPFITFTETGFPQELISKLEERFGKKIVGNKSASGTVILDELAEEEINNGHIIVYTSADSVLQICGNEDVTGLDKLYEYCKIAREITMDERWRVGRVVARPYVGKKKGEFKRTANRHDYSLKPSGKTVLDALKENKKEVIGVGKINDIFAGEGITESHRSQSSVHGMQQATELLNKDFEGLCFVNLVDFDALWGHRRNVIGYGEELERFDVELEKFLKNMDDDTLLMITADHGNDPVFKGTDHTRENVPLLIYSKDMDDAKKIGEADTFAVIGATIADNFDVKTPENTIGTSISNLI